MIYAGRRLPGVQTYKVRGRDEYVLTFNRPFWTSEGYCYEAVASLFDRADADGEPPTLAGTNVAAKWLRDNCREVPWSKIAPHWQQAFRSDLDEMVREIDAREVQA